MSDERRPDNPDSRRVRYKGEAVKHCHVIVLLSRIRYITSIVVNYDTYCTLLGSFTSGICTGTEVGTRYCFPVKGTSTDGTRKGGMGWVGWKVHIIIIIIPVWDASIENAMPGKCRIDKRRI